MTHTYGETDKHYECQDVSPKQVDPSLAGHNSQGPGLRGDAEIPILHM